MSPNPNNLLDPKFIASYFAQKITSPECKNINWGEAAITPIKKYVGKIYHLVIRYDIKGLNQPIFCSAHALENRKNAYRALKFIDNRFENKIVKPLFYSKNFNALFYLGMDGENLQYYIKNQPDQIENIVKLTAVWLAKLHQIKVNLEKHNFNPQDRNVETVVPGAKNFFQKINLKAPKFNQDAKTIFSRINEFDKKNLIKNGHYLIHGDIHPENVIIHKNDETKIAIIDYTDICIADFARDLGNFSHQLNYMISRFNPKIAQNIPKLQNLFLAAYLKKRNLKMTDDLQKRIQVYMAWTALRNTVFFLTKKFIETEEAQKSIQSAKQYLKNLEYN